MTDPSTNPVGFLQEFCQKHCTAFPKYSELTAFGPDHSREFSYQCVFDGHEVIGTSRQKKQAKSESAKLMIELLKKQKYFDKFNLNMPEDDHFVAANLESKCSPNKPITHTFTKNPISALYEYCQQRRVPPPEYFESLTGKGFVCECLWNGKKTYGRGLSKKTAKTEATVKMCAELQDSFRNEELVNDDSKKEELVNNEFKTDEFVNNGLKKDQPENSEKNAVSALLQPENSKKNAVSALDQPENSEKNAVSALEELCAREKSMPQPQYQIKNPYLNLSVVACRVGNIEVEGMDTTLRGAKVMAANGVLGEIIQKGLYEKGITNYPKQLKSPECDELDTWLAELTVNHTKHNLEEFRLSSDEEEGKPSPDVGRSKTLHSASDDSVVDGKLSPDLSITNTLHSLMFDDSVVEIEPIDVTIKTDMKIKPSENKAESSSNEKQPTGRCGQSQIKKPQTSEVLLEWAQKQCLLAEDDSATT